MAGSQLFLAVFDTLDYDFVFDDWEGPAGYFILIDTFPGSELAIGDTIYVNGQDGGNCGESLELFNRGDTAFLALTKFPYYTNLKNTFYLEGLCGKFYLVVKNEKSAELTIPEIKAKISRVLSKSDNACRCNYDFSDYYFFEKVSMETKYCLAIFYGYDYAYEYDGLKSQTGYFTLIDTIGNFETLLKDTIVVQGEDGINCGEMLNRFTPGDTMFLALSEGYYEDFERDTFYLKGGNCGIYFLNMTRGQYAAYSISEIKDKIRLILTETISIDQVRAIQVFPNPVSEKLKIITEHSLIQSVRITTIWGQTVFLAEGINDLLIEIDVSQLNVGAYKLHVLTQTETMVTGIVKL